MAVQEAAYIQMEGREEDCVAAAADNAVVVVVVAAAAAAVEGVGPNPALQTYLDLRQYAGEAGTEAVPAAVAEDGLTIFQNPSRPLLV